MADDDSPKPSIPSWQRTSTDSSNKSDREESNNTTKAASPRNDNSIEETEDEPDEPLSAEGSTPSVSSQLDQLDAFLEDPVIKAAPVEKKRAFLKSKSVPTETIETYLAKSSPTNTTKFDDFAAFKDAQSNAIQPSDSKTNPTSTPAPPIITYPEFLVNAHKPPPLITPGRILNAGYFAGSIAALLYGASQYLITPMVESLTLTRQDFAVYNKNKVDEFNERLSKIVSKIPKAHKESDKVLSDADDESSDTDEPTELYSRDFGTQTSPPSSRRSSVSEAVDKRNAVDIQTELLNNIRTAMTGIADDFENTADSQKERQESLNKLQNYVDTLIYATPAVNLWTVAEDSSATKTPAARDDVVEQLKKEIRGVKGLLLNARRFPSTPATRVGA